MTAWRRAWAVSALIVGLALSDLLAWPEAARAGVPGVEDVSWTDLREGELYFRVAANTAGASADLRWRPAWMAHEKAEHLYFYAPDGTLIERIAIAREAVRGTRTLRFDRGPGDYQLVIPGKSRRYYDVGVSGAVRSVLMPPAYHPSLRAHAGEAFFVGRANGLVAAKSHEGANRMTVAGCGTTSTGVLLCDDIGVVTLTGEGPYRDHERVAPGEDARVRVTFARRGKVGVWVTDGPNYLARRPEDWFVPELRPVRTRIDLSLTDAGPVPTVGAYFEFYPPEPERAARIAELGVTDAQYYAPEDVLTRRPDHDVPILDGYAAAGIARHQTILNDTGRDTITRDEGASIAFLSRYLADRAAQGRAPETIAFVDEPNLRYDDYETYRDYFTAQAEAVRQHPDPSVRRTLIAAPESSQLIEGPSRSRRRDFSGRLWLARLLADRGDLIDVVTWHEWNTRTLADLDHYGDAVRAAAEIVDAHAARTGTTPKPLVISQTNLNSGQETSPDEADTLYAGLWWAGVLAETFATGRLDGINWFKSVDEGAYPKGLMRCETGRCELKPVGIVFARIANGLGDTLLPVKSDLHGVRSFATRDAAGQIDMVITNGRRRVAEVEIVPNGAACPTGGKVLFEEGTGALAEREEAGDWTFTLPPRSIAFVSARLGDCP